MPGGWWPPLMLDPAWVARHHREFDACHVHFGFDAIPPDTLAAFAHELDRHGKPLVYTVHDLRNPHHPRPDAHDAALDVMVDAAADLITLTEGAAAVIRERWSRSATVLPHPHVVGRKRIERPRHDSEQFVVGVHAKSLRANMDPLPVIATLAEAVTAYPDAVLRVNVHDEIFEPGNHWYAPEIGAAILEFGELPQVEIVVHPYFDDTQLWKYLASLSVSVLPYRFGTHSGWLEACHDLGTAVIAPSCGFYGQQRSCHEYVFDETHFDPSTLVTAVDDAYRRRAARATWEQRRRERCAVAAAHDAIYQRVLA